VKLKAVFKWVVRIGLAALVVFAGYLFLKEPSHARNWKTAHEKLPQVEIQDNLISIRGVRNFRYNSDETVASKDYYDRTYDLDKLSGLWFGVQLFGGEAVGHAFVSFEFGDGTYLVLSIEARQEVGESYSVLNGFLREYELIYILADERDVIGLRTHVRKKDVYLYRIVAPLENIRGYLVRQMTRAQEIYQVPEFYNSITQNCATSLFEMTKTPALKRYSDYRVLLSGYAYRLLYEISAIDTTQPVEEVRRRALLDPSRTRLDAEDFSRALRGL